MMSAAKGVLGRLPDVSPWKWVLLLLALTLVYQIGVQHLDNRLYFWIKTSWHETEWENRSLWLPEYQVRIDALPVAGVSNNLSGLTYDEGRDQLWAVVNNPEELLTLSKEGELLARYPLSGFSDVEGITYLGGNQGFEGVGYDRAGDRLYVVKEHSPRKLYEVPGLKSSFQGDFNLQVIDRQAWIDHKVFATDLSSVHYDEQTGHLALLSDESKVLIELDAEDGKLISFRSLLSGFAGLQGSVPQGEGLTLDDQGNLYLVSEPNLFYRFERESRPGA